MLREQCCEMFLSQKIRYDLRSAYAFNFPGPLLCLPLGNVLRLGSISLVRPQKSSILQSAVGHTFLPSHIDYTSGELSVVCGEGSDLHE